MIIISFIVNYVYVYVIVFLFLFFLNWSIKKQHIHKMSSKNENVKMDKWEYAERYDLKWGNLLKDGGSPYWWKDEGKLLEMVWSCLEESE